MSSAGSVLGNNGDLSFTIPMILDAWLYGLHCVLFYLVVFVLLKRRAQSFKLHLSVMIILFICATMRIGAAYGVLLTPGVVDRNAPWGAINQVYTFDLLSAVGWLTLGETPAPAAGHIMIKIVYIISTATADLFMIYRCYVIWGYKKRVIVFPILLLIVTLVTQIVFIPSNILYLSVVIAVVGTLTTSIVFTAMIAGRIWWIGRKASQILDTMIIQRYHRTVAIMVESGLMYPIVLSVVLAVALRAREDGRFYSVPAVFAYNIVGIAPALVIVRVGLGVSTQDVETTVTAFQAHNPEPYPERNECADSQSTVMDIRPPDRTSMVERPRW